MRDTGAFLVLDEAHSLLADRRDARHVWEISQELAVENAGREGSRRIGCAA